MRPSPSHPPTPLPPVSSDCNISVPVTGWRGEQSLSPWLVRIALLWASVVLVVCLRSYLYPQTHSVYPIFSSAGVNWSAGRDCYVNSDNGRLDIYRYSPTASCVFVPFSFLPDAIGGLIWRMLQVGWFLAAFAWYLRDVWPVPSPETKSLLWLWLLLLPLSLESIN